MTLFDVLESLRTSARRVVFAESNTVLPHRDLPSLARPVASALRAEGAGAGDLVGLLMPTGPHWLPGFFGAVLRGAAVAALPLPPMVLDAESVADRLEPAVGAGGIRTVVATGPGTAVAAALARRIPGLRVVDPAWIGADGDDADIVRADPDATAVVQFSSGSTARPKGVRLTHRQFLSGVRAIGVHAEVTGDDVLVQWVPLFHDMGLVSLLCALLTPNDAHLFGALTFVTDPAAVLRRMAEVGATITNGPNFSFDKLTAAAGTAFGTTAGTAFGTTAGTAFGTTAGTAFGAEDRPLRRWRLALNGAEPVRPHTVREFARVFGPLGVPETTLAPCYGMAEATLAVTLPRLTARPRLLTVDRDALVPGRPHRPVAADAPDARELVGVGVPVPGIELRITALDGTPLPSGYVGEIRLRGPAVTSGYLHETDTAAIEDGWLRTGDLGLLDDGELVVVGRLKEMIVVQGRNFFPDDVEEAARAVPGVYRGHCVAVADTDTEHMLVVAESDCETGTPEADALTDAIRGAVSRALTLSAITVRLVPPRSLPRTTSGKWQRALVAALARTPDAGKVSP